MIWLKYKNLRNMVNIEHANAKKDYAKKYYAHKVSQANDDIKGTWKILNSARSWKEI